METLQFWAMMAFTVVAASTTGEYYFRRRKMKYCDFSEWRGRRITYMAVLAFGWYFATDLARYGNVLVAAISPQ